jgi:YidC/Oxa1 family membrane protein insertase
MAVIDLLFRGMAKLVAVLYSFTNSYGLAIIGLTIVVRLILFPLTVKQVRSMQAMAAAQPEIKKLQELYKQDRQQLNAEMMQFYRANGINPAAGCFPLLLQAPFLIALYNVIYGLTRVDELNWLMVRLPRPKYLDHGSELYRSLVDSGGRMVSFSVDLAQSAAGFRGSLGDRLPYYLLVVLVAVTGIAQQVQMMRKSPPTTDQAAQMQRIMKYLPILFAVFAYNVKAGVVLYWIAGNLWTMGQTQFLYRKSAPKPVIKGIDGEELKTRPAPSAPAVPAAPAGRGFRAALAAAREAAATPPPGRKGRSEEAASNGSASGGSASGGSASNGSTGSKQNGSKQNGSKPAGAGGPKVTPKVTSSTSAGKNTTKQTVRKPSGPQRGASGTSRSGKKKG